MFIEAERPCSALINMLFETLSSIHTLLCCSCTGNNLVIEYLCNFFNLIYSIPLIKKCIPIQQKVHYNDVTWINRKLWNGPCKLQFRIIRLITEFANIKSYWFGRIQLDKDLTQFELNKSSKFRAEYLITLKIDRSQDAEPADVGGFLCSQSCTKHSLNQRSGSTRYFSMVDLENSREY